LQKPSKLATIAKRAFSSADDFSIPNLVYMF
jgi:hypothetical protein